MLWQSHCRERETVLTGRKLTAARCGTVGWTDGRGVGDDGDDAAPFRMETERERRGGAVTLETEMM